MKIGLNLGSGQDRRPSTPEMRWINIDADPKTEPDIIDSVEYVSALGLGGSIPPADEIVANDILEHIPCRENDRNRWKIVLADWVSCLKPGGTIRVQVPNPTAIFEQYEAGWIDEHTMNRVIYGESTNSFDQHYQLFSIGRLRQEMIDLGLEIVSATRLHVCAIVIATKPV